MVTIRLRRLNLPHLVTDWVRLEMTEKDELRITRSLARARGRRPSTELLVHVGKFLKAATLFGKATCQHLGQPHKKYLCVDILNLFLLFPTALLNKSKCPLDW